MAIFGCFWGFPGLFLEAYKCPSIRPWVCRAMFITGWAVFTSFGESRLLYGQTRRLWPRIIFLKVIIGRDSVLFCDGGPHWKSVCLSETKHNKCEHHKGAKGAALEIQISEGMILRRKKEEIPTQWFLVGPLTIVCAANWSQTASPRSIKRESLPIPSPPPSSWCNLASSFSSSELCFTWDETQWLEQPRVIPRK